MDWWKRLDCLDFKDVLSSKISSYRKIKKNYPFMIEII